MDRHLVISSDCHAGPPLPQYRAYVEPKYRDAFDERLPGNVAEIKMAEEKFLIAEINERWRAGNEQQLTGAWDHEERVRVLDADGVAGEIIFPDGITEMNTPPFEAGLGLRTDGVDGELQWAGARAHNKFLEELCQMAPERRVGVAVIPLLWDIDEALKEIRTLRGRGLRAIVIPTLWGDFAPYHHPRYEPVWALCEDEGIVIHFHSGATPRRDHFGDGDVPLLGDMGVYLTEVTFWVARPLAYLIWGGVFERHPGLKVAVTEGQTRWAPEYLRLMDTRYLHSMDDQKLGDYTGHLSMKPSEYFARNVKLGASCMARVEAEARHDIGVGSLMWGTDYPHPEGSWPDTANDLRETFGGLPQDDIAAILGGNAAEFYGFDVEKLAPLVDRIGPPLEWFDEKQEPIKLRRR
jgi:predicted TIM-barrel fold metal-dependent hydrolase